MYLFVCLYLQDVPHLLPNVLERLTLNRINDLENREKLKCFRINVRSRGRHQQVCDHNVEYDETKFVTSNHMSSSLWTNFCCSTGLTQSTWDRHGKTSRGLKVLLQEDPGVTIKALQPPVTWWIQAKCTRAQRCCWMTRWQQQIITVFANVYVRDQSNDVCWTYFHIWLNCLYCDLSANCLFCPTNSPKPKGSNFTMA